MSLRKWITGLGKARDAAAVQRVKEEAVETSEERAFSSGGIDAIRLDEEVAEHTRETRSEPEQLGD